MKSGLAASNRRGSIAPIALIVGVLLLIGGVVFGLPYLKPRPKPVELVDFTSFLNNMEATGASVSWYDAHERIFENYKKRIPNIKREEVKVSFDPLSPVADKVVSAFGVEFHAFEYVDQSAAEHEAAQLSRDGRSLNGRSIAMCAGADARPHFYTKSNLLVLYVGRTGKDSQELREALGKVMGSQIAGFAL